MEKQEIWKPVPGYEGYKVSDKGRVRSYFVKTGLSTWGIASTPQRILKPSKDPQGYPGVCLRRDDISYQKRIHRLVLLAFVGPCPDGLVGCHNNDIPDDNRLENLRYDSQAGNMRDARSLSIEDIKDIRRRRASFESLAQIARDYNVSYGTIACASAGLRSYEHVVDADAPPVNDYRKKLMPTQVSIIKWLLLNEAILRQDIAARFGVSPSMITRIANGTRWGHVLPADAA